MKEIENSPQYFRNIPRRISSLYSNMSCTPINNAPHATTRNCKPEIGVNKCTRPVKVKERTIPGPKNPPSQTWVMKANELTRKRKYGKSKQKQQQQQSINIQI